MSTISVPLTSKLEIALDNLIKDGYADNKAEVMRRALTRLSEDEAVNAVLRAQKEISLGKGLRGDLRTLAKQLK